MIKQILNQAIKFGDLGTRTDWLADLREFLLDGPQHLVKEVGDTLWEGIKDTGVEILYGTGVGALPVMTAIKASALADGVHLTLLFVRETRKDRNLMKLVEGPLPADVKVNAKAIFVDDVLNRGNTLYATQRIVEVEGYVLQHVGCACIVDFWTVSRKQVIQGFKIARICRRHDLGLTRIDIAPKLLGAVRWHRLGMHQFDVMPTKAPPAILFDKLYAPTDTTELYCLDLESGEQLWKHTSTKHQPKGSTCRVQSDGSHVYWSAYDGVIRKADPHTGKLVYQVKVDHALHATPCLSPDKKTLYISTEYDKHLIGSVWNGFGDIVALDAETGTLLWRYQTGGMMPGSPIYSEAHDFIISGSNDCFAHVLDASGKLVFKLPTKGEVKNKPLVHGDVLITQSVSSYVQAWSLKTGEKLWERKVGRFCLHPEPIMHNGLLLCASSSNIVFAFEINTGVIQWICQSREPIGWGVSVFSSTEVLAASPSGYMITIDCRTGKKTSMSRMPLHLRDLALWQQPVRHKDKLIVYSNNKGIASFELNYLGANSD